MTWVIDASIAVKWVVDEDGTPQALALRRLERLIAPDLLIAECANILWKKVQRGELTKEQATLAAGLLEGSEVELPPTRPLLEAATRMAIELDHPAYDCVYLALAAANTCAFITADERLVRKIGQAYSNRFRVRVVSLKDAAIAAQLDPA